MMRYESETLTLGGSELGVQNLKFMEHNINPQMIGNRGTTICGLVEALLSGQIAPKERKIQ